MIEIKDFKFDSEQVKNDPPNFEPGPIKGNSLNPYYELLCNQINNFECNLDSLDFFGFDYETNKPFCQNVEHKLNKGEFTNLDSKLNKSKPLKDNSKPNTQQIFWDINDTSNFDYELIGNKKIKLDSEQIKSTLSPC